MPPPAPPSPPHPPGWVNPSPAPSSSDDVPPDYASLDEELDDSDYMDAYYELLSYTEGEEASPAPAPAPTPAALSNPGAAPRASTAPPSSAGRRHLAQSVAVSPPNRVPQPTVFNAISYNVTDPKLRAAHDQRLAGYMGLRVSVSKVDPQLGTATLSIQAQPFSLYSFPFGILDRKKVAYNGPKNVSTLTTMLSAINTVSASVRHTSGDGAKVITADVTTSTTTSLYFYPFDQYSAKIELQTTTSDFNSTSTPHGALLWRTALLVRQRNLAVGWTVTVEEVTDPYDVVVPRITNADDGSGYVCYTITLQRTSFVKFFACITLIFMWILGTSAIMYAMDALYLRPRNLAISEASMFFMAVFAYGNMRNLMPDVPKVGVGVDFFGYIWIVLMLMGTSALIYARVVGQVVHNEPTLYDKVFNRPYYLEWTAEQAKKKAEEKKKEEEAKLKKEEEKSKKEAEEAEAKRKEAEANANAAEAKGVAINLQDVVVAMGPKPGPSTEKK